jgi:hypothetical protein
VKDWLARNWPPVYLVALIVAVVVIELAWRWWD